MPLLVIRHEPFEHLGHFADILQGEEIPFVYKDMGDVLALAGFAGLILMGGPQSANDPALASEMELVEEAIRENKPVLGICLGSQLIAKALGAKVYRNPEVEIGWEPVHLTQAGRTDPLFAGLASPSTFFHWHGETFDLPQNAEWLAYSPKCLHQAFRFGTNVYGIQFHPEITPEMIVDWYSQPANCGDVETLPGPLPPHAFDTAPLARQILQNWLSLFGANIATKH